MIFYIILAKIMSNCLIIIFKNTTLYSQISRTVRLVVHLEDNHQLRSLYSRIFSTLHRVTNPKWFPKKKHATVLCFLPDEDIVKTF